MQTASISLEKNNASRAVLRTIRLQQTSFICRAVQGDHRGRGSGDLDGVAATPWTEGRPRGRQRGDRAVDGGNTAPLPEERPRHCRSGGRTVDALDGGKEAPSTMLAHWVAAGRRWGAAASRFQAGAAAPRSAGRRGGV
uniref:Uncharacterized protein n=1 Tax=Arundo donax TaxID=35708 RepID=A0A0A9ARU0_ARUDO